MPEPNCNCKKDGKPGSSCGKWGYDDNWCYTVGKRCGKNKKSNWKNCEPEEKKPNCDCIGDDKPGNKCDFWGYDSTWCYTKDKKTAEKTKCKLEKLQKRKIHAHAKVDHRQETPVQNGDIQINGAIL